MCNYINWVVADGTPHALSCCLRMVAIPADAPDETYYIDWVEPAAAHADPRDGGDEFGGTG